MLRHPLNEQEFSFSKWQVSSTIDLNSIDAQPTSLSLPQLGSRPFDLSNAVMESTESLHRNKSPRLSTNLDEKLNTSASTTDDDQSMTDANEYSTTTYNIAPDYMNNQDQGMGNNDIWATAAVAAAAAGSSTNLTQQTPLLSWDDENNNDKATQSHSPYLTESRGCIEAIYQRKFPDALVVKNERLIKDVVNLLTGTPSLCFEWNTNKLLFQLRETGIRLVDLSPGVIQRILQPMIKFGTRMKMVEDFITHIQSHPVRFGSIAVSFACCLGELLSYIQHTTVLLFTPSPPSSVNQQTHQPQLLEIHHRMEGFFLIMDHLTDLCSMKTSECRRYTIPRGSELLTLLYNKALDLDDLQTGYTGFLKAIYTILLINTSTPWLTSMTRWLNDGVIHDPYQDFFIINDEHNNSTDEMATSLTINTSALPCFLPKKYAELVLHAGMSILQQKVDSTALDGFRLSWLDTSWSSKNLERIIHQQVSAQATPYPLTSPPTLSTLSDPDTHLQHEQQSIFQLNEYITNQESNYTPSLPILLEQQLLEPIQHRCQLISSLYVTPSTISSLPTTSLQTMGRRDMLYTYWDGHSDQYPSSFQTDLVSSPFKISTFLLQQRQHRDNLSTPSSSILSNSIN